MNIPLSKSVCQKSIWSVLNCAIVSAAMAMPHGVPQADYEKSSEVTAPMISGVVSYSDWGHVFFKGYNRFDEFWGENGVRYIVDRSSEHGMERLYWRMFDGASALYPSELEKEGRRLVNMSGAYDYDMPEGAAINRSKPRSTFHIELKPSGESSRYLCALSQRTERFLDEDAMTVLVRLKWEAPKGGDEVPFFYLNDGAQTWVAPLPYTLEDDMFQTFRILWDPVEGGRLKREYHSDESVALKLYNEGEALPKGMGVYWTQADGLLRLDRLYMASGLQDEQALFPDEAWDILELDFGPIDGSWKDNWTYWLSLEGLSVEPKVGDHYRYMDFRYEYLQDTEVFGAGHDSISKAVELTQASGMEAFIWFTLGEENHYGNGAMSRFVRLYPEFRDVDGAGNIWKGRVSMSFPEVRAYKVALIKEAVDRYQPEGVMIDLYRMGLRDPYMEEGKSLHYAVWDREGYSVLGFDSYALDAFEEVHGFRPTAAQNNDPRWVALRISYWTEFFKELRQAIPDTKISLLTFPLSAERARNGLLIDWQDYAESNLIDEIGFMLDNGVDGRPFVQPFGSQPLPPSSVESIVSARRQELPAEFPVAAAIYAYRIKADAIAPLTRYAIEGGADEVMWWETAPIEWADYSGAVWRAIKEGPDLSTSATASETGTEAENNP